MMESVKSVADWMADRDISMEQLLESTALDRRVLKAIVSGQYTASPQQRQRLAAVLSVDVAEIAWGHTTEVQHIYGHGPQFGRSP
jgi:hypothetical protein